MASGYPRTAHNSLRPSGRPDWPGKINLSRAGPGKADRHLPVCRLGIEAVKLREFGKLELAGITFCLLLEPGLLLMRSKVNMMSVSVHERGTLREQIGSSSWSGDIQTESGP